MPDTDSKLYEFSEYSKPVVMASALPVAAITKRLGKISGSLFFGGWLASSYYISTLDYRLSHKLMGWPKTDSETLCQYDLDHQFKARFIDYKQNWEA